MAEYEDIFRLIDQIEKRFKDLHDTDVHALEIFRRELAIRLQGFPEQFATKSDFSHADRSLRELEQTTLSRAMYDSAHQVLEDHVNKMERDKLNITVFETFIENYRIDQDKAIEDRRNVVQSMMDAIRQVSDTSATERTQIREQLVAERTEYLTHDLYDQQHGLLVRRVEGTERWQYKLVGGLVFATFVAPLVSGVVIYFITRNL